MRTTSTGDSEHFHFLSFLISWYFFFTSVNPLLMFTDPAIFVPICAHIWRRSVIHGRSAVSWFASHTKLLSALDDDPCRTSGSMLRGTLPLKAMSSSQVVPLLCPEVAKTYGPPLLLLTLSYLVHRYLCHKQLNEDTFICVANWNNAA